MPSNKITIKHNKHRVHPCPNDKKLSLLDLLIAQNKSQKIVVATTNDIEVLKEALSATSTTVLSDNEISKLPQLTCDILISYDLPSDADVYIKRVAIAKESAVILLDIDEQKQLYLIETLLGRAIKQEPIKDFEYEEVQKIKIAQKLPIKQKREYAFKADTQDKPKKDNFKSDKKSFDKPKYEKNKKDDKFIKKDKKQNKYLGKDENGKAIFSGKSGDRNHRYDGTPKTKSDAPKKVGRKISIKERKSKEGEASNS